MALVKLLEEIKKRFFQMDEKRAKELSGFLLGKGWLRGA